MWWLTRTKTVFAGVCWVKRSVRPCEYLFEKFLSGKARGGRCEEREICDDTLEERWVASRLGSVARYPWVKGFAPSLSLRLADR